jgi:hypothetical protein
MLNPVPLASGGASGRTRLVLILAVSTMVSAWLSLWVALLAVLAGSAVLVPGPAQEALVLGAALLARYLLTSTLGARLIVTVLSLGALAAVLLTLWARFYTRWAPFDPRWLAHLTATPAPGPLIATVLAVLVLWWTGSRIAASPLDEYAVFRFFAIGVAGLFAALIVGGHALPTGMLALTVVLFFALAFITLPAAQLMSVRERGRARGARLPALDRHWAGTAAAATVGIVLLALLLTALSSGTVLSLALDLLGRIPDLLLFLLYPLILAAGYLVQALIDLVRGLMGHSGTVLRAQPQPLKPLHLPQAQHAQHPLPPVVHALLGGAILLVVAVAVVLLLSRAVERLGATRHDAAYEEERDSVWDWNEAAGWQGLLGRLRGRFPRRQRTTADDVGPPRSVRAAYRRLLQRAAAMGHPRATPETPREYLARLQQLPLPGGQDAVTLTDAYTRVRYGDETEQADDIERAADAWARLDQALQPPALNAPSK